MFKLFKLEWEVSSHSYSWSNYYGVCIASNHDEALVLFEGQGMSDGCPSECIVEYCDIVADKPSVIMFHNDSY